MLPMKVDPLPLPVLVLQLLDPLLPPVLIVPQLQFNPLSVQVLALQLRGALLLLPSSLKLFRED